MGIGVWNLDNDQCLDDGPIQIVNLDTDCPVEVLIPGPSGPVGPALTVVGMRSDPALITTTLIAPVTRNQLSFVVGSGGPIDQPILPNPPDNNPWIWWLFTTDDVNTLTLNDATNLQLSGQWVGSSGSILQLFWDGVSKYVEVFRNEI